MSDSNTATQKQKQKQVLFRALVGGGLGAMLGGALVLIGNRWTYQVMDPSMFQAIRDGKTTWRELEAMGFSPGKHGGSKAGCVCKDASFGHVRHPWSWWTILFGAAVGISTGLLSMLPGLDE